jgi:hypothetical protein
MGNVILGAARPRGMPQTARSPEPSAEQQHSGRMRVGGSLTRQATIPYAFRIKRVTRASVTASGARSQQQPLSCTNRASEPEVIVDMRLSIITRGALSQT